MPTQQCQSTEVLKIFAFQDRIFQAWKVLKCDLGPRKFWKVIENDQPFMSIFNAVYYNFRYVRCQIVEHCAVLETMRQQR